jgi:asparagine synthase (glutamine-hydrolysing)
MTKYNFTDRDIQSRSDVEVILPLYINKVNETGDAQTAIQQTLCELDGEFSFILTENTDTFDLKSINMFVARDIFGAKPIYMLKSTTSASTTSASAPTTSAVASATSDLFYIFTSELKGIPKNLLSSQNYTITEIPPGYYWSYQTGFVQYYSFVSYKSLDTCTIKRADPDSLNTIFSDIKTNMEKAVMSRFVSSDQKVGLLMSGGFDSCIILNILLENLTKTGNYKPLNVFSFGDLNDIQLQLAQQHVLALEEKYKVDIHHHIIALSEMSMVLSDIPDVIESLETYHAPTIRKTLPYVYLLKYIKEKTDIKVLLTGDGLDELGGYSDFLNLTDQEFQNKSVEMLENCDLLRLDKIGGKFSIEFRYPFLNKQFIEYFLSIHPRLKKPQVHRYSQTPIEKYIIRKAFEGMMSRDILWNTRSDIDECLNNTILDFTNDLYSDSFFNNCIQNMYKNGYTQIPKSKEELYYFQLFDKFYNGLKLT